LRRCPQKTAAFLTASRCVAARKNPRAFLTASSLFPPHKHPTNPTQTDASFEIEADLPGVKKEDVHVDVEGDTVRLSCETCSARDTDKEVEGTVVHRSERSATFASRSLRFPPSARLDGMTARLEGGVLRLSVPKKTDEAAAKKRVAVE
jgi:HSP20 family protein